nr:orotidine 5'-phosphate decarboxylase / HUMPS family protein [Helicobacter heilmannii]
MGSLQDAKAAKADFIVIGRPIYQAKDPAATTAKILESLENANL